MSLTLGGRLWTPGIGFCASAALLAGCGGGQPPLTVAPVAQTLGRAIAKDVGRHSWMAPDAVGQSLLYVSEVGTGNVNVYSYPQGKLKGTLSDFVRPQAMCVDKEGDVFVPDLSASKIFEYRHGAKQPRAILEDPHDQPSDCSVDPKTGNLAVTNISTPYTGPGNVLIFHHAKGEPRRYRDPDIIYYLFCGYDAKGDLYLDGMSGGKFKFAELPAGKSSFTNITLDEQISYGGAVQWDGSNIAVGNYESKVIYRFSISGESGTTIGKTDLHGSNYPIGFWIQGTKVIAPNDDGTNAMVWNYPSGGSHVKTIGGLKSPWGAAVSPAK
jgi:hypothetical protein